MSVPTKGETYSKLMEYLRLAQESAATMAHLSNANDERQTARMWLKVSENFKHMQHTVTTLATRGLQ